MKTVNFVLVLLLFFGMQNVIAQADVKENVAMIKKNLADSKEKIKKYEWIETTTVFYKGEQKSVIQKQCYYSIFCIIIESWVWV